LEVTRDLFFSEGCIGDVNIWSSSARSLRRGTSEATRQESGEAWWRRRISEELDNGDLGIGRGSAIFAEQQPQFFTQRTITVADVAV